MVENDKNNQDVKSVNFLILILISLTIFCSSGTFYIAGYHSAIVQLSTTALIGYLLLYIVVNIVHKDRLPIFLSVSFVAWLIFVAIVAPSFKYESVFSIFVALIYGMFNIDKKKLNFHLGFLLFAGLASQIYEGIVHFDVPTDYHTQVYQEFFISSLLFVCFLTLYFFHDNFFNQIKNSKQLKSQLDLTETRYKKMVENMPLNVLQTDLNGKRIYGTKKSAEIFGAQKEMSEEELIDFADLQKRVHPEDLPALQQSLRKVSFQGGTEDIKVRGIKDNGEIFYLAGGVTALFDINKNPEGFVMAYYDETEAVLANKKVRESEKKYKTIVESANALVMQMDYDSVINFSSSYANQLFGVPQKGLVGTKSYTLVHPEAKERFWKDVEQLLEDGSYRTFFYRCINAQGQDIYIEGTVSMIQTNDGQYQFISIFNDVTDREIEKKKRKRIENEYKNIFENAPLGITIGADNQLLAVNPFFCQMVGYSEKELLMLPANTTLHQDDVTKVNQAIAQIENNEKQNQSISFRLVHKDGSHIYVYATISGRFDLEGQYIDNLFVINDVTDLISVQKELSDKSSDLNNFFNISQVGIVKEKDSKISYINPYLVNKLGYKEGDIIGNSIYSLINKDDQEFVRKNMRKQVSGEAPPKELALRLVTADQRSLNFLLNTTIKFDDNNEYIESFATFTDVTQLEETKQRLSEREATLKSTLNAITDGIYAIDKQYNVIALNDKAIKEFKLFGNVDIALNSNIQQLVDVDTFNLWKEKYFDKTFSGKSITNSLPRKINDKALFFENTFNPIKDENGLVIGMVEVSKDLTEILQKEKEALTASQQRRDVFDNNLLGIIYLNYKTLEIIDCNKAAYAFYGIETREEFEKAKRSDFEPSIQLNGMTNNEFNEYVLEQTLKHGQYTYTYKGITVNNEEKIGLGNAFIDTTNENCIIFFTLDVTDQYRTNQRLLYSESRFKKLFENNQFGIVSLAEEKISLDNSAFRKIIGSQKENSKGADIYSFFHPEDVAGLKETIKIVQQSDLNQNTCELRFINQLTGITGYVILTANKIENPLKKEDIILTMVEITQRKYAQLELKKSEERYRNLLNVLPNGIGILTFAGQSIFFSEKGQTLLEPYLTNIFSFSIYKSIDNSQQTKLSTIIETVLNTGEERKSILKFRGDDGQAFYLECQFSIMKEEVFAQSILWIFTDITKTMN